MVVGSKNRLLLVVLVCGAALGCESNPPDSVQADTVRAAAQRLGAVGIGVSDLPAASTFYQQVLGLEVLRTYELGYLDEVVLGFPNRSDRIGDSGAVLVLMHWPRDAERGYDGGNVKVVFYVDDPAAVIDRIRALGGAIDREATPHPALNGRVVGLGRGPDGYVVEVVQQ